MTEKKQMNAADLEAVAGGGQTEGGERTVNTHTVQNAAVRSGPGKSFPQIESYPNGTGVWATGYFEHNYEDGRTWYKISYPDNGWIAGRSLGYDESDY